MADREVKAFKGKRRAGLKKLEKAFNQVINGDAKYPTNPALQTSAPNTTTTFGAYNLVVQALAKMRTIHDGE